MAEPMSLFGEMELGLSLILLIILSTAFLLEQPATFLFRLILMVMAKLTSMFSVLRLVSGSEITLQMDNL
jgi:hypothetical protein